MFFARILSCVWWYLVSEFSSIVLFHSLHSVSKHWRPPAPSTFLSYQNRNDVILSAAPDENQTKPKVHSSGSILLSACLSVCLSDRDVSGRPDSPRSAPEAEEGRPCGHTGGRKGGRVSCWSWSTHYYGRAVCTKPMADRQKELLLLVENIQQMNLAGTQSC